MSFLSGLFDKEKMVADIIKGCLEDVAVELGCSHEELFIMIKPKQADFDFKCWVYKIEGGNPKLVREIPLKEILGDDDE